MNTIRTRLGVALALMVLSGFSSQTMMQAKTADLPMMPLPSHVQRGTGAFVIDSSLGIVLEGYTEPRLVHATKRFTERLTRETGIPLWGVAANKPTIYIKTAGPSAAVQKLGEDESYHLRISATEVRLEAANPLGILRGLQSLLQLVSIGPSGFIVPGAEIDDSPRFPWRGLMIDSARHFMPLDVILRSLDGMEAVKLNVFHWHLSEDQGFRAESLKHPLLQRDGSDGLYYTQSQIREVLDYARERGIRVVPEFDVPCHTSSWFVGYPQLASGKVPYHIERTWGIFDAAIDPTRETTYTFMDSFIGEMTALFPDSYFHIGGDECSGKEWDTNVSIRKYMREHQIKSNAELQVYFTSRIQKIVANHGKIMEGWDEVLGPGTPKDVVIQSWRGQESLASAAQGGYRGLLSAGYYIDLNHSAAEHYAVDPMGGNAASLNAEEKQRILGGEAAIWSEYVTPETIDSRIWPRTAAIAERLWSPQNVQDVDSMYDRMGIVAQKLVFLNIQPKAVTEMMLRRMTGSSDPAALRVLASIVQPPQGYARGSLGKFTSQTPLNRLVDAVPPESETARLFMKTAQTIAAGNATAQEYQAARQSLIVWRDNDAQLQPMLAQSALTAELGPLSANVRQVAEIGLKALDRLQNHLVVPGGEENEEMVFLKKSERPQAILLNMLTPAVERLVQASKGKN